MKGFLSRNKSNNKVTLIRQIAAHSQSCFHGGTNKLLQDDKRSKMNNKVSLWRVIVKNWTDGCN